MLIEMLLLLLLLKVEKCLKHVGLEHSTFPSFSHEFEILTQSINVFAIFYIKIPKRQKLNCTSSQQSVFNLLRASGN